MVPPVSTGKSSKTQAKNATSRAAVQKISDIEDKLEQIKAVEDRVEEELEHRSEHRSDCTGEEAADESEEAEEDEEVVRLCEQLECSEAACTCLTSELANDEVWVCLPRMMLRTNNHSVLNPDRSTVQLTATAQVLATYYSRGLQSDGSRYLRAMRKAMKDLITDRNRIRHSRWEQGETDVSDDEVDLIEMTPGPSRTTTPEKNPGSLYLGRVMVQLSPSSRSKRPGGNDNNSNSDEEVVSNKKPKIQEEVDIDIEMDNIVGWHPHLKDLAHNKVTLITSVCEDGKKRQVLDTSKYRDETMLSTEEWREAMENMVAFALEVLSQEHAEHWDKHRRWFLSLLMFAKDFEILKQMDIKLCRLYVWTPFTFKPEQYHQRFEHMCADHISTSWTGAMEELCSMKIQTTSSLAVNSSFSGRGASWYGAGGLYSSAGSSQSSVNGYTHSRNAGSSSGNHSFCDQGSKKQPTCLICVREGHRASIFPGGRPVYVRWAEQSR
ncbi:hypothetical protein OE88DRAFT_1649193 [Heliocybe sulcata]|uniref:Uncharacterized protein n=1 Tax=Heliocybe sulcata TaxID=5364 RepID=A0A5C3MLM2_9AGAM|nr:hypothetical protein OE88DRAFT_1649193 [Heliocybe sulcata]